MSAEDLNSVLCPRCSAEVNAHDKFCRRCGTSLWGDAAGSAGPAEKSEGAALKPEPHSRAKVLVLLFVLLGPLALGVLWKSPRFSRVEKWSLTILVAVLTVIVFALLWWAVDRFIDALGEVQRLQGDY